MFASAEFLFFADRNAIDFGLWDVQFLNDRVADHANSTTCNSTHREFFMTWNAQFPDNEDVQRRIQGGGDLVSDRHAAARQSQNQNIRLIFVSLECSGEPLSSLRPITKSHAHF